MLDDFKIPVRSNVVVDDDAEERRLRLDLRRRFDEALEVALQDSFPASDPPAVTQPPPSPLDKDQP
jgi:hypothetical protein